MRFLSFAFLIGYGALLFGWMGQTPAYNGNLRVQTASGDTVLADLSAMYDQAEYFFEVGYGFVVPDFDLILSDLSIDQDISAPLRSFEETQLQAQQGVQYLERSLALSPMDSRAWMALAWGRALSGSAAKDVLEPLRQSWSLAPYDRILADRRISLLATVLLEEPDAEDLLSDADNNAIAKDIAILKKFDPATIREIAEMSPGVSFLDQIN